MAVWRLVGSTKECLLPMPHAAGRKVSVRLGYPSNGVCEWRWHEAAAQLSVSIPERYNARIFIIDHHDSQ
ncbi:hypothetical protein E5161_01215 [Cohnella pontilimi]|uniref:Uncharacterized protein n=1 Tax=Cohnella pontilimi TaxID=2564100 RepID=A0A4U0FGB6_9BACL|nr:hypothetical protein [Cohnella pontilimi]TJY44046.1 hypothetical protein E5161_01215 [Cohnella pontilimi]